MTDQLGSSARALLDAAREGLSPDAAAVQRVRAKVNTAVASGAAAGATGSTLAVKLGLLAVVAVVATGAYLFATRNREPAPRPAIVEQRVPPPPAPAPAQVAVVQEPADEPIELAPDVMAPSPKPKKAVAHPTAVPVVAPAKPAPAKPNGIELAREVELVDRAMAALRRNDPRAALAAVHTHVTETAGAGQLAEDAAAIEIEALCKLHDASVGSKLAAFDARWPQSAQRSRLTSHCP